METQETSKRRITWAKGLKYGLFAIGGISLAVLFAFVFGYFVMLLWNWLMPGIFGLGVITYWQAFGLIILARLVFGTFGHKHGPRKSDHPHWKAKYHAKRTCGDSSWKDWKYYDEYWKQEGKDAFEEYVKKQKEDNTNNADLKETDD